MRAYLFVWTALLGMAMATAAPLPPAPPVPNRQQLREDSQRFAQQLHRLIGQVVANYVRPVSHQDLLETALIGLFQAARKPVPHDLRAQVRQAVALSTLLAAQAPDALANRRPAQDPCERLLTRLRESLGDSEALAKQDAVLICCKAMTRILDPHSGVVTPDEQSRAMASDHETFGPGLEIQDALGVAPLVVESVQFGGPAQRAGLRPGDVISHIDGQPIAKAPPQTVLALRNQRVLAEASALTPAESSEAKPVAPPSTVRIRYRRPGETEDRRATLMRERFRPETVLGVKRRDDNAWNYLLDEKQKIAQVRVTALGKGTADELRTVLADMMERKVRGLILDLRWCPGGYLDEAVEVADMFLGNAVVATVKTRGREDVVYRSTDQNKFRDFAMVVLVNDETSGGAELIAAALQDHHQAVVVGQRTRGKGSVQTFSMVGVGGIRFKLTSGTFHRPSGKNLHRFPDSKASDDWGVTPDEDFRVSAELGKRLKDWWALYSLRPVASRERLALDDPRADPQQLAAREVLRRRLERKVRAKRADSPVTPERRQ